MTATDVPLHPGAGGAGWVTTTGCITVDRHAGACGAVIGGVDLAGGPRRRR